MHAKAIFVLAIAILFPSSLVAEEAFSAWQTDYSASYVQAHDEGKMLLIWFAHDQPTGAEQAFARLAEDDEVAAEAICQRYVPLRLARSAYVRLGDEQVWLLGHPSFAELLHQPGLAVIDLRDRSSEHYGKLVSLYPYRGGEPMDLARLRIFLSLPEGTLTQRTMVFAVRTHHESPLSTHGELDPYLAYEAAQHSAHQASITRQGHHNWDRRFQVITARLPAGLHAKEVCAEGWPWQGMIEAAEDCVHCWRQSSGHWSTVRSYQPQFGYDMKRGRNGVWYATGIFGTRD
jgi:hypothetical protein